MMWQGGNGSSWCWDQQLAALRIHDGSFAFAEGAVTRLAAEVVARAAKGLPGEDEVASPSVAVCPCVRGVEVSCAACINTLPVSANERLALVVAVAGDMLEVEADGMELGALGAGLCVRAFVDTVADPMPITPGAEEGADDTSDVDGWDVTSELSSVLPLVLLCCGVVVAAVKRSGRRRRRNGSLLLRWA